MSTNTQIVTGERMEILKENFMQFWNLRNSKPLVSVKAYADKKGYHEYEESLKKDKRYRDPFIAKTDPTVFIEKQVEISKYRHFSGETLPLLSSDLGPGICAAFLRGIVDVRTCDEPTWVNENLENWEDYDFAFNENNIWWTIQKHVCNYAGMSAAENNMLSGIAVDIYNGIDTLMLLRGSENLALDLMLFPDQVKAASKKIIQLWKQWIDELLQIQSKYVGGNGVAWLNLWGPERTFVIQSDFMTMISADHYEEFILDDIRFMCDNLDHVMFHFDGPDEIVRHLDFLLEIPNLHGIQWNPATNCENVRHIPTLKRIQEAGKCLVLNISSREIDDLLRELSPEGLLLNVDPFDEPKATPEEAEVIVNHIKDH